MTRLRVPADAAAAFPGEVDALLAALSARPGFRGGHAGEAAEEPGLWALVTAWDGVGAYRRALSAAEVKIAGAPVWVHAVDEPGVFLPAP
ncbi:MULTISPECIES: antibiotic biosynthesis monooxygenase [unclassified Blastococcus]